MTCRFSVVTVLLFFAINTLADNRWFQGVVVLKDDKVLVGELKHDSHLNLIQMRDEETIKTYSAFQVNRFNFYDTDLGFVRRFISVPFEEGNRKFSDAFFELIIKGEISLLRREKTFNDREPERSQDAYNVNGYTINNFQYQHAMAFDYYYQTDGQIIHSDRFKKLLLSDLKRSFNYAVEKFIKDNKLNVHKIYDQVLIIRFYNKIYEDENYLTAS